jgi:predicted GNAT superfamily acetyltransferase
VDGPDENAREAAAAARVVVRTLTTLEEAAEVVRLQTATWGEGQVVPRELIRAFQRAGVPPLGAFDGGHMVGFVLGFVGAGPDGIHVHSHMLAVEAELQQRGVGRALKLAQRAWALAEGIGSMRWTFDPMIARNAAFNLEVLRVVADRFHRNYYGEMTDAINRGERTDRLEVVWDLTREPEPSREPVERVRVHPDHLRLRADDPDSAAAERDRVADALERAFARGRIVVGFDRASSEYLLTDARP